MKDTIAGVDLSKEVIQVCISKRNKVLSNTEMTPGDFLIFLQTSKPMTIVFEACGLSNYWHQEAEKAGHDARLQHSTGGKVRIGSIGKHVKNKSLRSYLTLQIDKPMKPNMNAHQMAQSVIVTS